MVAAVDSHGTATIAASEAGAALARGDTPTAREKFAAAGAELERRSHAAVKGADREFLRFLAATQYYKGGHYDRARGLAKKVQARLLPDHARGLWPPFLRDVETRSSPGYAAGVRKKLGGHWQAERFADSIRLLQSHPYVFDATGLSFWRAILCERLGNFRAAALFFAAASRHAGGDVGLVTLTAAYPLELLGRGLVSEAWDYVRYQVELFPHPVTFITASAVAARRESAVPREARDGRVDDPLHFLDRAWAGYQRLPEAQRNHPHMREYMAFGLGIEALVRLALGDGERVKEVCDRAIRLWPDAAEPWRLRGYVTGPGEHAIADFRKAITFPSADAVPYLFLAAHAWESGDPRTALALGREALARKPGRPVEAQLVGWMAVFRDALGADRGEVEALFRKALEIAPDHPEVNANYRVFLDAVQPPARAWGVRAVRPSEAEFLSEQESRFSAKFRPDPLTEGRHLAS